MAIEKVREYFKGQGMDDRIMEFPTSSATVALAAEAAGVIPARICKTISFRKEDGCILVETAGDAKIDNGKYKKTFGLKAKMLTPQEVLEYTGHAVGGVCAFAIDHPGVEVYSDISLQRFETVFPACGSSNSAIELNCQEIFQHSGSISWVDVCKGWKEEEE